MSLDVYLSGETKIVDCICDSCGHEHKREASESIYDSNITHNLNGMARAAGIYKHLWRPEEIGVTKAKQLIQPLQDALKLMRSNPERFKKYDAENGWGTYAQFLPWIDAYLAACEANPEATVSVSR